MLRSDQRRLAGYTYIHALRCCAMYLVIALHCVSGYISRGELFGTKTWWLCNIVNGFSRMGVPTFFMISGFLLLTSKSTLNIREFYKKRLTKILPPFLVWNILYFLRNFMKAGGNAGGIDAIHQFFSEFVQHGSKYHLWYVYQIVGLYLLMPFLKKIVDSCSRRETYLFLLIVLLQPTVFRLFNVVQSVVYIAPFSALMEGYAGFLVYGYLLGTRPLSKRRRLACYALGLLGMSVLIIGNYLYSSAQNIQLVFNETYCIVHYLTAGALFLFVKTFFETREEHSSFQERVEPLLRQGSRLSYGVYLSHVFFLECFGDLLGSLSVQLSPAQYILGSFLTVSIVSTAVMYLVSQVPGLRRLLM